MVSQGSEELKFFNANIFSIKRTFCFSVDVGVKGFLSEGGS